MNTALYDLKHALAAYNDLLNTSSTEKTPDFWKPFHVCLLTMAMRTRSKNENFDPSNFKFSDDTPTDIISYLSRMKMWHALGVEPPIKVNERDCTGRFMPLQRLEDREVIDEMSDQLRFIMQRENQESVNSAKNMLSEILDNCFAHSESDDDIKGLVCAQSWPRANRSQITILDNGIGIRNSLEASEKHHEALKEKNSCEYSTEWKISSKLGKGHAGYGLTLAKELIQNNGGTFILASYDEYFISKGAILDRGSLEVPFQGTIVILEWNTNIPLDIQAVYDYWSSKEGDDNDYHF